MLSSKIYIIGGFYSEVQLNSAEINDPEFNQRNLIEKILNEWPLLHHLPCLWISQKGPMGSLACAVARNIIQQPINGYRSLIYLTPTLNSVLK
jgi:hypothetical protein